MPLKTLATVLFILCAHLTYAQFDSNWIEGYVILENGDTIRGHLKEVDPAVSCNRVWLERQGTKTDYSKEPVVAYQRGRDKFVKNNIPRNLYTLKKPTRFVVPVCEGKVSLYRAFHKVVQHNGSSMHHNGMAPHLTAKITVQYFLLKNGVYSSVNRLGFRAEMMKYFSENEDLVLLLKKRKIGYEQLEMIVKIYNKYN